MGENQMNPIDWATRPLKKYADFTGRAPRAEYWWFYLLVVVAYLIGMIIDSTINSRLFGPYGMVMLAVFVALVVPTLAAGVRRLHDTNRSGWWMLGPILPYGIALALIGPSMANPGVATGMGIAGIFMLIGMIAAIALFVFFVLPGTRGPNRFGEDPYAGELPAA